MRQRRLYLAGAAAAVLLVAVFGALLATGVLGVGSGEPATAVSDDPGAVGGDGVTVAQAGDSGSSADPLIFSYGVKFVCQEATPFGSTASTGIASSIVQQKTEVVIHNPQNVAVDVYKKGVEAKFEQQPQSVPGGKLKITLLPDRSFRVDCDDFAKLLTNNQAATYAGTFGIGVKEEGMVVLHSLRQLDVTAQYVRGSEVLKKDISYQPWWYWWWPGWNGFPWRLGSPLERTIQVPGPTFDCRDALTNALIGDTGPMTDPLQKNYTIAAINAGRNLDETHLPNGTEPTALVPLIGGCRKYNNGQPGITVADVDYVIVSNRTPSDQAVGIPGGAPICLPVPAVAYPWIYGRFSNLNVVLPNNIDLDMDQYMRDWKTQAWVRAGATLVAAQCNMAYYFNYWCGWGYWYWWWNGGDCENIGVGEGESLQAEQITPTRVFCNVFPPVDNDGDTFFDEDPPDGINQDPLNGAAEGEDPVEC